MKIEELRKQIDRVDSDLIQMVAKRLKIVEKIAKYKAEKSLEIVDAKREKELLSKWSGLFASEGISDEKFVRDLFGVMIKKSRKIQFDELK